MKLVNLKIDVRPDWLTVTGAYDDPVPRPVEMPENSAQVWVMFRRLCGAFADDILFNEKGFKEVKSPPYYRYALHNTEKGIMIAFGGSKQGYMIQFQGHWWATTKTDMHVFKMCIAQQGLKPTRLDWSMTISRNHLFDYLSAEYCFYYARKVRDDAGAKTPRIGLPTPKNDLNTVNFGSRESAKFMRIYDKHYWSEDEVPAIRFEMEYKRDAAIAAWRIWLVENDRLTVDMLNFAFQEQSQWPAWMSWLVEDDYPAVPSTMPKEPSNRDRWFNGVVKKSFVQWALEEPVHARQWLANALHQWTDLGYMPDESWRYEELPPLD